MSQLPVWDPETLACYLLEAWEVISELEEGTDQLGAHPAAVPEKLRVLPPTLIELERIYRIPAPVELVRPFLSSPLPEMAVLRNALSQLKAGLTRLENGTFTGHWGEPAAPIPPVSQPSAGIPPDPLALILRQFGDEHPSKIQHLGPETEQRILALQDALFTFEENPADESALDAAFRQARMLTEDPLTSACQPLADVAGPVADVLRRLHDGELALNPRILGALTVAADLLFGLLETVCGGSGIGLKERMSRIVGTLEERPESLPVVDAAPVQEDILIGFVSEMRPLVASLRKDIGLAREGDSAALHQIYVSSHRLKGSAAMYGLPNLAKISGVLEARAESGGVLDLEFATIAVDLIQNVLESVAATGEEQFDADLWTGGLPVETELPAGEGGSTPETDAGLFSVEKELRDFYTKSPAVFEYFGPDAEEHIEAMQEGLEELEARQEPSVIAAVFRHAHSLKGDALTVGCQPMGKLAHIMEDALVLLREGGLTASRPVVGALLSCASVLRDMLAVAQGVTKPGLSRRSEGAEEVLKQAVAKELSLQAQKQEEVSPEPIPLTVDEATPPVQDSDRVAPAAVPDPERSQALLQRPQQGVPQELGPDSRQAGGFQSSIRVALDRIDALMDFAGELVVAREFLEKDVERLLDLQRALDETRNRLSTLAGDLERTFASRPAPSEEAPDPEFAIKPGLGRIFTEFELDRYDEGGVGARRITEISADILEIRTNLSRGIEFLQRDAKALHKVTRGLREAVSRTRMIPVGQLFARSERVVTRIATGLGKSVRLETVGGASEVDSSIMSQLAEPLLHLLQNAAIHGIEQEERRLESGKPAEGVIRIEAFPRGRFLHLEVSDDGQGIDLERIRKRARTLIPLDPFQLTDQEATQLIFLPGLSTAAEVTQSAGRGVGLDVVRSTVARLNGSIRVESGPGQGTKFFLRLPMTLMVTDVLEVAMGPYVFAIPLSVISRVTDLVSGDVRSKDQQEYVDVIGEDVPLFRPSRLFGLDEKEREISRIVVLNAAGRHFAITVDESFGIREAVVKDLGELLAEFPLFPSATVSTEGRAILVLDALVLFDTIQKSLAEPGVQVLEQPAAEPAHVKDSLQILLVDDSLSVRKIVGQMLTNAGYLVTAVPDGEEAIDLLRTHSFDTIITDLEMPRVNGYELLDYIRRRPDLASVPVVVITTRAGEKHSRLTKELGASECLSKPVDQHHLIDLVGTLTRRRGNGAFVTMDATEHRPGPRQ